mgnify:CR=1 FL=1
MQMHASTGCVLMASGLSTRFGSNKLLAPFDGQPLLYRAFAATDTPQLSARIVVTRSAQVQALCKAQGVPVLLHALPGRNDTVRLGLSALLAQHPELTGCMFLPGDQPLLRRATVDQLLTAFEQTQKETERVIFRLGAPAGNGPDPLVGSPVLSATAFSRSCSPCRRARAAASCCTSTRRWCIPPVSHSRKSWPTPIRPPHWRSWKRLSGKRDKIYSA